MTQQKGYASSRGSCGSLRAGTVPEAACCCPLGRPGSSPRGLRSACRGAGSVPVRRGSAPRSWTAARAPRESQAREVAAAVAGREAGRARSARTAAGGRAGMGREGRGCRAWGGGSLAAGGPSAAARRAGACAAFVAEEEHRHGACSHPPAVEALSPRCHHRRSLRLLAPRPPRGIGSERLRPCWGDRLQLPAGAELSGGTRSSFHGSEAASRRFSPL